MSAPIPALRPLRPIEVQPRHAEQRQPRVGELLRLRIVPAGDGSLLGRTEDGQEYALPAGLVRAGESLLLRVLSREPRLQLQLLPPEAPEPDEAPGDEWGWRALRPDQGRLQRWQLDRDAWLPAQVAVQWRAQVLAEQLRTPQGVAAQAPGPESLLAAHVAHAAPAQLVGWLGQVLWLRLLSPAVDFWPASAGQADAHEGAGAQAEPGLHDGTVCLSLNLETPDGWVLVLLQWRHGLLLHCCAERAEALPWLRSRLPAMARALAAVPLRLRHCSLSLRPPPLPEASPAQRALSLASAASQPLFRAAAEIVRVLQVPS